MKPFISILILLVGGFSLGLTPPSPANIHINWVSMEEAGDLAVTTGKKIIVDVYTSWCGWCKRMDRDSYEHDAVVRYINENYIAVKFNAEQKEDVTLGGKTFKFVPNGRRGYHELAATMLQGKMSYPSTVFIDEKLQRLTTVPGYLGPVDLLGVLTFFGDDVHKSGKDVNVYLKEFKEKVSQTGTGK
ncbi:MAG: DUF255 domain-containing protein [Bacteroidota bacterium]